MAKLISERQLTFAPQRLTADMAQNDARAAQITGSWHLDVSAPWNRRGREGQGLSDPVSTSALATALADLDDLVVVAQPSMGKTTTLFQIAEAVLANANALPIVIPLADWSADGASLLESITLFADLFFGRTLGRLGTSLLPWWCVQ